MDITVLISSGVLIPVLAWGINKILSVEKSVIEIQTQLKSITKDIEKLDSSSQRELEKLEDQIAKLDDILRDL